MHGDGLQSRDFTYVENVVNANIAAALYSDMAGMRVNVATGKSYTILDVVQTINKILGTHIHPEFTAARKGDVRKTCADVGALQAILPEQERIDFYEGLVKTIHSDYARETVNNTPL